MQALCSLCFIIIFFNFLNFRFSPKTSFRDLVAHFHESLEDEHRLYGDA